MSAQVNLVAFDGASTPVSHTLAPVGVSKNPVDGTVAEWRELLSAVPAYANVSFLAKCKLQKNGMWRVEVRASVPVMETVSGQNAAGYTAAPKIAYTNVVSAVGYFHERSTTLERRLVRQLMVNALGGVVTSVAPVTTGNVAELFDNLISPS